MDSWDPSCLRIGGPSCPNRQQYLTAVIYVQCFIEARLPPSMLSNTSCICKNNNKIHNKWKEMHKNKWTYRNKIGQWVAKILRFFRFFKMAAATILDCQIHIILLADSVWMAQTHHCTKFHQNWSCLCGDIYFLFIIIWFYYIDLLCSLSTSSWHWMAYNVLVCR